MYIDTHVHLRDGIQSNKETIAHGLYVAELAGFTMVMDMPNTDPPVTHLEQVMWRIRLAEQAKSPVFYGTYMAVTSDENQLARAVDAYYDIPQVVGFKMFAGESTGDLAIPEEEKQRATYERLARRGYTGVIAVHCEKESLMKKILREGRMVQDWDPKYPISHACARPPEAEVESVKDQIVFARDAGFRGTLHIPHISVPKSVEIVKNERLNGMNITCGVTPHHVLMDMTYMEGPDGLMLKMNPPLRPPGMKGRMLEYLRDGSIDWVETDHAPHTIDDKLRKHMSGIPGLHFYPRFIDILREKGFGEDRIREITFEKPRSVFNLDIEPRKSVPRMGLRNEYEPVYFSKFW